MLKSIIKNKEVLEIVENEEKRLKENGLNVEIRRLDVYYRNHRGTRVIVASLYDEDMIGEDINYNDVNPKTLEYENGGENDKLVSPKRFFNMIRANKWKEIKREVNV